MKKKGALLGSVLAVTVSSAPALAADVNTPAGLQGTTPSPLQNAVLGAKEFGAECESVDNSTATSRNAGEFCLASDHSTSTTGFADPAVANEAAVAGSQLPRVPLRDGSSLGESRRSPSASAPMGPVCVSVGGSIAATRDEGEGGFCLASDLSTPTAGIANFAFANSLPAAGLQFLQVTLRDGSHLIGSRPIPSAGAPIGPVCVSVGGSSAATMDEGEGAFCLASDLSTSSAGFANFAFANSLPAAGLQFLQITFADGGSPGGSLYFSAAGAECVSNGGSTAATGDAGRFCLVSDLSTSTAGFANLSVANELPAAGMQYLQVTFRDGSRSGHAPDGSEPMGAVCVSVDGSTATTGDAGACLASDLRTLTSGAANFAVANNLLVAGLQYLQVTFRDGSPVAGSGRSPGAVAECVSVGGSTAATGNTGGFCLVSDRNTSKTGFANFAIANDLPVAALQFVRVPFRDGGSLDGSRRIPSADAPTGVVISDPDRLAIQRLSPPALVGVADHPQRYLRIRERRSGIVMQLSPHGRRHPRPVFWLSRPLTCNGLPVTIAGTFGNDTLVGTPGNDVMHGRGGNDVIHGLQGNDVICGGAGNDQLFGNQGKDQLFGGTGNDVLKGGRGNDRLFGQEGNDAMDGQGGNDDNCNGSIGADTATSCEQPRNVP